MRYFVLVLLLCGCTLPQSQPSPPRGPRVDLQDGGILYMKTDEGRVFWFSPSGSFSMNVTHEQETP